MSINAPPQRPSSFDPHSRRPQRTRLAPPVTRPGAGRPRGYARPVGHRRRLPGIAIRIEDRRIPAATLLAAGGPYALTLSTILPDHGIELHTTYTGHPHAEHTAVTSLFLTPGGAPHPILNDQVSPIEIPVTHTRRRCLYDHLTRLQDHLAHRLERPVRVELADSDLLALET